MRICILFMIVCLCSSAYCVEVVDVNGPDSVVVEIYQVPVTMRLAHVEVADSQKLQDKASALLKELVSGKKVKLKYDKSYGEAGGTGKVHLLKSLRSVNVKLIEAGLAAFVPGGDDKYAKQMQEAEQKAKTAKKGMWSDGYAKSTQDSSKKSVAKNAAPAKRPVKSKTGKQETAAFCAERGGKYYYASDSREAKRLNPRKIVYYKTEKDAQRAGKKKPNAQKEAPVAQTMESANELMAKGEELYYKAVDMTVSDERDKLYGDAFDFFTKAMLIYRSFFEKDQDNAKLGETLRQCMQLRYGAMKYKRP